MKIKLCNVHKLAVANEGEERKPIFIPFGTWPYDDMISQTLDRPHAEGIAADLDKQIAAGEPGIPVYQGHPDVPEYAGKYPDKGAMGWVKKILVNENGMECQIEWDRDPGKGFGWFSPYWIGDKPVVGPDGKKNVIVDGLTSIGLVNNPNIREFRLANEAASSASAVKPTFELPEHLVALAKKFDERRAMANVVDANGAGHGADGKFDGSGSGGGGGAAKPKKEKDPVFETESKIEKAISSKIGGGDVTVGIDGSAVSIGIPSEKHADAALAAMRGMGEVKSSKIRRDGNMVSLEVTMAKPISISGGASAAKPSGDVAAKFKAAASKAAKDPAALKFNDALKTARKNKDGAGIARAHAAALKAGMVWDKSIKGYRPPVVKVN